MFVAEFQEDVRIAIPAIVKCLKDSDWYVRKAAIEVLSRLAAQGMYVLASTFGGCSQACL